jgi:hypothetical protein
VKKFLKQRRTPWDVPMCELRHGSDLFFQLESAEKAESPATGSRCKIVFYFQDCLLVDPTMVEPEDTRLFMWAGLRALRTEVKRKGLPDEQVNRLMEDDFWDFHDATIGVYRALKRVQAIPDQRAWLRRDSRDPTEFFYYYGESVAAIGSFYVPPVFLPDEDLETAPLINDPQDIPMQADSFVACEEDRPVPIQVKFKKLAPLLDPDAEIMASFKP